MQFYTNKYFGEAIGVIVFTILILTIVILNRNEFLGIKSKLQKRMFTTLAVMLSAFLALLSAHLTRPSHGWINPAYALGFSAQAGTWFNGNIKLEGTVAYGLGAVIAQVIGALIGGALMIGGVMLYNLVTPGKTINLKETFTWKEESEKGFGIDSIRTALLGVLIGVLVWFALYGANLATNYTENEALKPWGQKNDIAAVAPMLWILGAAIVYGAFALGGGTRMVMLANPIMWIPNFMITLFSQRKISWKQFAIEIIAPLTMVTFVFISGSISYGLLKHGNN